MPRRLQPCGTRAAYQRHYRNGEKPCRPCRDAYNSYQSEYARDRGNQRAYQRALKRLARMHPNVFDALYAEELAKEADR